MPGLVLAGMLCTPMLAQAGLQEGIQAVEAGEYAIALQEFQIGADRGDAESLFQLGKLYESGLGVPQNFLRAHVYYNLAGARGLQGAIDARDALASRMTSQQVAHAQELATEWQPKSPEALPSPAQTESDAPNREVTISWAASTSAAWQAVLGDETGRLKELLSSGTDPNAQLSNGGTLLTEAVRNSSPAVISALVDAGADVNKWGSQGVPPLKAAIYSGRTEVARLLLARGADPSVTAPDGLSALALAQRLGHAELVQILTR